MAFAVKTQVAGRVAAGSSRKATVAKATKYDEELVKTAVRGGQCDYLTAIRAHCCSA
jgi:hypothetical protein